MNSVWHILRFVLDFYRRLWQAFLISSPALLGAAYLFKNNLVMFITLLIAASICFVIAFIGLYCDYQDARRKEAEARKAKAEEDERRKRGEGAQRGMY
jgi:hypothetical protein